MPTIVIETRIEAAPETCFDLARDIGLHCETVAHTEEKAVAGRTTGLIGLGESVTFEAVHFGIRQRLAATVVEYQWPHRFVDRMTAGAFHALEHIHEFDNCGTGTLMRDTLTWTAPLGVLGLLADKLVLRRYMEELLRRRNEHLKAVAEAHSSRLYNYAEHNHAAHNT